MTHPGHPGRCDLGHTAGCGSTDGRAVLRQAPHRHPRPRVPSPPNRSRAPSRTRFATPPATAAVSTEVHGARRPLGRPPKIINWKPATGRRGSGRRALGGRSYGRTVGPAGLPLRVAATDRGPPASASGGTVNRRALTPEPAVTDHVRAVVRSRALAHARSLAVSRGPSRSVAVRRGPSRSPTATGLTVRTSAQRERRLTHIPRASPTGTPRGSTPGQHGPEPRTAGQYGGPPDRQ